MKTREEIRSYIIKSFLKENPGKGKGDLASRYEYLIKKFNMGEEIYLSRPGRHYGVDFAIKVKGFTFYSNKNRKLSTPAHYNVLMDLEKKKKTNPKEYENLKTQIDNVFNLKSYDDNIKFFSDESSIPTYILLELIKWFFIEQDITYWNYSGRNMFKKEIDKI